MENTQNNIKKRRKELKMTQEDVAAKVGVRRVTILKYENGEINIPSDKLAVLAGVLDTTTDYLMGPSQQKTAPITEDSLSAEERFVLKRYREASEEIRAVIDRIVER